MLGHYYHITVDEKLPAGPEEQVRVYLRLQFIQYFTDEVTAAVFGVYFHKATGRMYKRDIGNFHRNNLFINKHQQGAFESLLFHLFIFTQATGQFYISLPASAACIQMYRCARSKRDLQYRKLKK